MRESELKAKRLATSMTLLLGVEVKSVGRYAPPQEALIHDALSTELPRGPGQLCYKVAFGQMLREISLLRFDPSYCVVRISNPYHIRPI